MSDDDEGLFRRSMGGAKRLRSLPRVEQPRKKPKPVARFTRADEQQALQETLDDTVEDLEHGSGQGLRFKRPGISRTTMRMLVRGSYAIQAEIDLHGMTVAEARPRLASFIERCAGNGKHCVRIVHGKGLGSGERGPVLKTAVNSWLRKWDTVLAFASARQFDGGTGALYVLLRNR